MAIYNTHGHKLRIPPSKKAQFVTECGIAVAVTPEELKIDWQSPAFNHEKELRPGCEPENEE